MTVQIKLLKGFKNPINNEDCSVSLLVKSDLDFEKHMESSKKKLLIVFNEILNFFKTGQIKYYHKIGFPTTYKTDYKVTRSFTLERNTLETNLNESILYLNNIRIWNAFNSHFVNIKATKDSEILKLSNADFQKLNYVIRSKLSLINSKSLSFSKVTVTNPYDKAIENIMKNERLIANTTNKINKKYISLIAYHIESLTILPRFLSEK